MTLRGKKIILLLRRKDSGEPITRVKRQTKPINIGKAQIETIKIVKELSDLVSENLQQTMVTSSPENDDR